MAGPDELAIALSFMRDLAVRVARRTEPLPFGVAVFDERLPAVWDLNLVWVDRVPGWLDAPALTAEVERVQATAGLRHRHVIVADERGGARLAGGLAARGWSARRRTIMAHRRPGAANGAPVRKLAAAEARAFLERSLAGDPAGLGAEVVRQLGEARDVLAAAGGARSYGAVLDGVVVSACDLYHRGSVAQIESVLTLAEHRGRGLASAVVGHALARARSAGCELAFLQVEEDGGPRALYERLGFDPIGSAWVLERYGEPSGSSWSAAELMQ